MSSATTTLQALVYLLLIFSDHWSSTYAAAITARRQAAATATASATTASPTSEPLAAAVNADHAPGDLSLDPSVNLKVTLETQNQIINAGESLSLGITNTLISPFVFVNNHLSQAAGTLPAIFAANGAILGTAIATPIQLGALAANNVAAGVTGTLVSLPISLASGATAQLVGVAESGRELYRVQVATLQSTLGKTMPSFARPVAILGGANAVIAGTALGALSNGVQRISQGVHLLGTGLANAGSGLSGVGSGLAVWGNGSTAHAAGNETEAEEPLGATTTQAAMLTILQETTTIAPTTETTTMYSPLLAETTMPTTMAPTTSSPMFTLTPTTSSLPLAPFPATTLSPLLEILPTSTVSSSAFQL